MFLSRFKRETQTNLSFFRQLRKFLESLEPVVEAHPEYEAAGLIERLVEPERVIYFQSALGRRQWKNSGKQRFQSSV